MKLEKVDTGFFNLYLASELFLSDKTEVRNLLAQKQSVLSAISQSSVHASRDVRFIDNETGAANGYTMQF